MDINNILEIKLTNIQNTDEIKISKKDDFHLISIQGLGSPDGNVNLNNNVRFDGSKATSRRYRSRNIVMEIEYLGNHKIETRKMAIKFFNMHTNGYFYIRYANTRYKIPFICESMVPALDNVYEPFRFMVSLICPDPFFRDHQETIVNIVEWKKALVWPVKIKPKRGVVFGRKIKKSFINLHNTGHVKTGFIATFKANGDVINPYILNTKTREQILIKKEMLNGEIFIIDTNEGNKGVEMFSTNEEMNGYRYLSDDSTFMQLEIGDNILRYGADAGLNNLDVSIQYSHKYLGV